MKLKLLLVSVVFITLFSSCKKEKDLVTNWIGTYTSPASSNTFNQVVIAKVNDNTVKMELKTGLSTYAIIDNAKITSSTTVSVNEDGSILFTTGTWHFSGAGTLNGNTLTLNGKATQEGQSDLQYTFSGSR